MRLVSSIPRFALPFAAPRVAFPLATLPLTLVACVSTSAGTGGNDVTSGSGGVTSTTGGTVTSTSTVTNTTGGMTTTGSGGVTGTTGGMTTTGVGTNTGGPTGSGGTGGTGGTAGVGGTGMGGTGTGGSSTTGPNPPGEWGTVEDPGAHCEVGPMPSFDSLMANPKLPDPFMKMDGTRMTDKSEWVCRREEILQQMYAFIWGDKPVPPKEATTGTVSESSISVSVEVDGKSTSFSLTVNMNGATAPAPAIISYGAGAPVPNGVASISFRAVEQQGGSGPKSAPFYDVYGSDHPAGYLTGQAWQISRVLDLLEQDPSVIDPTRVGLTGCSRNGKGAFVGGALDNRIALTIPVESGLGGTIGLRLVELLGGDEWPYHGISYVRWMSEVALGQFTTGNSAAADNTDRLPVDMHEMMALIAPRGLYIVDNPSIGGLDPRPAWVTGNVGKMIFEGLGVGDHMAYQGAGGSHCQWRTQYQASLDAMVDKFLRGNDSANTGNVATDLGNQPNPMDHIDWDVPTLTGEL